MFNIELAGVVIRIENHFEDTEQLCRDYLTDKKPEQMSICVTEEEMQKETAEQINCYGTAFSDGYTETVCIYRKIAIAVLKWNVILLHASVIEVDHGGYAFLGHSGIGKTTQTALWMDYFGKDRARVINGDKPLIRVRTDGIISAYGTPWCGKEGYGCNANVPLKGLIFLKRSEMPSIQEIGQEEAFEKLSHQLLWPKEKENLEIHLTLLETILKQIPCYELSCNRTMQSVETAWNMVGKN